MTCTCQQCGQRYRVDLLVPDDLWERIKPEGKPEGAGLLCGPCIMNNIEKLGHYGALHACYGTIRGVALCTEKQWLARVWGRIRHLKRIRAAHPGMEG